MNLKERAKQLKTDVPAVFLALKDNKTPWYAKLFAALAVAYALSPIDFIPDFIPVLGYLDDLILLPLLIMLTLKFIPENVFDEYRARAEGMWQDGKPKKWYCALPIILIWALVVLLVVKAVFFNTRFPELKGCLHSACTEAVVSCLCLFCRQCGRQNTDLFKKKRYCLGAYKDIEDAAKARAEAEERLHDPEILERFHDLTPERQKEFKEYLRQTVSTLLADQLG